MANTIATQTTQTMSLLTSALNFHLNTGQNLTMNTSSVFVSLEPTSIESLSNKLIQQVGNASIQIPSKFELNSTNNTSLSLRVSIFHSSYISKALFGTMDHSVGELAPILKPSKWLPTRRMMI